jgi:hypothetical protein
MAQSDDARSVRLSLIYKKYRERNTAFPVFFIYRD